MNWFFLKEKIPQTDAAPQPIEGIRGYFRLYCMHLGKLIGLNLLTALCSLPVVTMPAARAALVAVCRLLSENKPVYVLSEYFARLKENWKQATLFGLPALALLFALYYFLHFFAANMEISTLLLVPFAAALALFLLLVILGWYARLMIVSIRLPLSAILKNAWKFTLARFRKNFVLLLVTGALYVLCYLFFPGTMPLIALLLFSTVEYLLACALWPDIRRNAAVGEDVESHS